jgi:hypothetical protein
VAIVLLFKIELESGEAKGSRVETTI